MSEFLKIKAIENLLKRASLLLQIAQNTFTNDPDFIRAPPAEKEAFFSSWAEKFEKRVLSNLERNSDKYGHYDKYDLNPKTLRGKILSKALNATKAVINELRNFADGFKHGQITSVDVVESFKEKTIDRIGKVLKDIDTLLKSDWAKSVLRRGNQKAQGKNPLADKKQPVKRKKQKPKQFSSGLRTRDIGLTKLDREELAKMWHNYSEVLTIASKRSFEDHVKAFDLTINTNEAALKRLANMQGKELVPLMNRIKADIQSVEAAKKNFILGWQAKGRFQKSNPGQVVSETMLARAFGYDVEHKRLYDRRNFPWTPEKNWLSATKANNNTNGVTITIDWTSILEKIVGRALTVGLDALRSRGSLQLR